MTQRRFVAVGLLAVALALTGCAALGGSGSGPPANTATATESAKLSQAQATHEYPAPPPPPQTATGGAAGAADAVRAFAARYINWSAGNVTQRMRELAAASVGQARSAMALAAAQTAGDYELRRGGVANSGKVEAIAPLPGRRDQYIVVTREQTSATNTTAYQGLRPAWHIALAAVTELTPGQWVLSRWQPEN